MYLSTTKYLLSCTKQKINEISKLKKMMQLVKHICSCQNISVQYETFNGEAFASLCQYILYHVKIQPNNISALKGSEFVLSPVPTISKQGFSIHSLTTVQPQPTILCKFQLRYAYYIVNTVICIFSVNNVSKVKWRHQSFQI